MPTILKIYEDYKIMPNLQLHQLRVAAVAKQICDSLTMPVDTEVVVKACLLHDMANIIKFNLDSPLFPNAGPDMDYWKQVQQDYRDKYGPDEHKASVQIARELGMNDKVLDCVESIDFVNSIKNAKRRDFEAKICDNADMHVDPHGVVSIDQRIEEGAKRYKDNPEKWLPDRVREEISAAIHSSQDQIFAHSKIKPSDITDESIAPIIERLKTYEI